MLLTRFCAILLSVAVLFLVACKSDSFPELPDGVYFGALEVDGRTIPWLFVNNDKQTAAIVPSGDGAFSAVISHRRGSPLMLTGPWGSWNLQGAYSGQKFEGAVRTSGGATIGSWHLGSEAEQIVDNSQQEFKDRLRASAELRLVEQEVRRYEDQILSRDVKLKALQHTTFESSGLRQASQGKLTDVAKSLEEIQERRSEAQTELDALRADLERLLLVNPRGRLVNAARQSLQREGRWFDAVMRAVLPEVSPEFERTLFRAQRVEALKQEIAVERAKVATLEDRGARQIEPAYPLPDLPKEELNVDNRQQ